MLPSRPAAGALASAHRLPIDRSFAGSRFSSAPRPSRRAPGADQAEGQSVGGFLALFLGVGLAEQIEAIILPDTATSSRTIGEVKLIS